MMTTPQLGDGPHPVVTFTARDVLNKSENERSGVFTAMSFLGLYRDSTLAEATSRCVIRLIFNQIGRRLTEWLDGSDGIERRLRKEADVAAASAVFIRACGRKWTRL